MNDYLYHSLLQSPLFRTTPNLKAKIYSRSMEQYDVRWFEEPVVPEDLEVVTIFYLYHHQQIHLCVYASGLQTCTSEDKYSHRRGGV